MKLLRTSRSDIEEAIREAENLTEEEMDILFIDTQYNKCEICKM